MKRALVHAYELAAEGTPDAERAALGVVRAAVTADSANGVPVLAEIPTRADTLRGYLHEKEGYLLWRLGDRAGSLRAYGSVWSLPRVPLPDSLAAETVRAAAYVAVDSTLGPLTRADTLGAIRLFDQAATWARASGENAVASRAFDCLSILLATFDGDTGARLPAQRDDSNVPLLMLLSIALGVTGLWGGYHYVQHRWKREDEAAIRMALGV